jgi:ABC-2 type transport system permease protein
MTTATVTTSRTGSRPFRALLVSETRLYLRETGNVVFVLVFPLILLIGMGFAIPGMRETITDAPAPWYGLRAIDLFAPIMVCVAVATAGLSSLPAVLAGYRERGVLRRLSTTPMRPQGVLLAQLVVQAGAVLVGAGLALVAGNLVFGIPVPVQPLLTVALLVPAVAAIFGIGLLIGGLAPKASTASGLGMLVYFPMLFFAGLWTPGPMMPDAVEAVARFTPLGAASQAMTGAWLVGGGVPWLSVGVMVAWAAVLTTVAARTFRWS